MTGVLYITPLITWLLAKTKKITSHSLFFQFFTIFYKIFYNLFVPIRRVDQQGNSVPKTLTSLSNRITLGLTSYRTTFGVTRKTSIRSRKITFLDSSQYMLSSGQLSKNDLPPEVGKARGNERSIEQH